MVGFFAQLVGESAEIRGAGTYKFLQYSYSLFPKVDLQCF
jgi:hypothetical protein